MRRLSALLCALIVVAGPSAVALPAIAAAVPWPSRQPDAPFLVKDFPVPVKPLYEDPATVAAKAFVPQAVSWPSAGSVEVAAGSAGVSRAGGLPVHVSANNAPVHVELADPALAHKQGVDGLLLRLRGKAGETAKLTIDYSSFRHAYGGDWATRLRFVRLDSTGAAKVLPTRNDLKSEQLSTEVTTSATDTTYAVTAAANGQTGDYKATSLAPEGKWSVSLQSGDFDWSYPIRVPTVPGGLEPTIGLSYSSGAVDGHTAATNNQPSWAGEGWSLWPGYIERGYGSCADDITVPADRTGDMCWGNDNATMSLDGHSSQLVYAGGDIWRPKNDDGSRVQRVFGGVANGDNDNEWWKVTTTDGTQYFFGRATTSAWTVPVFGDDSGEPCHGNTFAASSCSQAYRWNLDFVVDTHGNTINYTYATETNNYSRNLNGASPARYVRGGWLQRIDYGGRGSEHSLAQVTFDAVERGGPDVPWDQACADGANCGTHYSPSFWTTKRLATITTRVWDGAAYRDVDRWTLAHQYPQNQDQTTPSMWLHGITHTGLAASPSVSLPELTFDGTQLPNRINSDTDGLLPLHKWRMYRINTESGGAVTVNYTNTDCVPTALPTPESNTKRCFPQTWTPDGDQLRRDWMAKYVVGTVSEEDRVGGQQTQFTDYDYLGGTAWHLDDNPLTPVDRRTFSQYRGFGRVVVRHGDATKGPQSATGYTYLRGMAGATVTDSRGVAISDAEQLQGFLREKVTYEGVNGRILSSEINDPWQRGPNATQGSFKSYFVEVGKTINRTAVPSGWRTTEVSNEYTDDGLLRTVNDLGDLATSADDQCTTTTYARNQGAWILALVSEVKTVAVACTATPVYPRDGISGQRTTYDGGTLTVGNVTKVESMITYPSLVTMSTSTYDGYGRVVESTDANGHKTTTAYAPTVGLPTSITVTDPAGWRTTSTQNIQLNQPTQVSDVNQRITTVSYDALGRITGVWQPGRATSGGPTMRYTYGIRGDGPSWVKTEMLRANNNYVSGYELYDGFLRSRQTQTLGSGGPGRPPVRVLSDTLYDSHGLAFQNNGPYTDGGTPGTQLMGIADNQVPSLTRTTYDAAERPTVSALQSMGQELQRTTTAYFGDRIEVTPPAGAPRTTTYVDAHGRTTQLWQNNDATSYSYSNGGQLSRLTDAAGNHWDFTYDMLGRRVTTDDPDSGLATTAYDNAGRVTSTTDARQITLAHRYDSLGRKTETHQGSLTGPLLVEWTYDTVAKGQLASAKRYLGSDVIATSVTEYDAAYRPLGKTVTIPASQAPLSGTFTTRYTYKPDGSPDSVETPGLPGLAGERLTYLYDDLGQPYSMGTATTRYVSDAAYTAFGELSQIQFGTEPKHVADTYYFDLGTRRLTRSVVDEQGIAAPVQDMRYTYDPAGNVTRIGEAAKADNQCFTYDPLRRLREAWTTTASACGAAGSAVGGPSPYWTSYTYDAIGNRLSQTSHSAGALTATSVTTYTHPAPGEPRPHALTSSGYAYDPAGYTISRPGQTLTWTPEGKLGTVTAGTAVTTNTYDADANLLLTKDSGGAVLYLDGAEIRHSMATNQRTSTRYYIFGGQTVGVRTAGGLKWMIQDHHGTDNLAIDSVSLAATDRRSDPFGNPRGSVPGDWPSSHGFVGGVGQGGTGLTHLGVREFDPATGTFLSVDPLMDPGNPQQLNAYAYANNNPATMSDPSGAFYFVDADGLVTAPGAQAAKSMGAAQYEKVIVRAQNKAARIMADRKRVADSNKRIELKDKRFATGGDDSMVWIKQGNISTPMTVETACATGNGLYYGTSNCNSTQVKLADYILAHPHYRDGQGPSGDWGGPMGVVQDVFNFVDENLGSVSAGLGVGCIIAGAGVGCAVAAGIGATISTTRDIVGCIQGHGCEEAIWDVMPFGAGKVLKFARSTEAAKWATAVTGAIDSGVQWMLGRPTTSLTPAPPIMNRKPEFGSPPSGPQPSRCQRQPGQLTFCPK